MKKSLLKLAQSPRRIKLDWALKLLMDNGHSLGSLDLTKQPAAYEIDGKWLTVQQIYALAAKYPGWNDRLGLGTATLPRVSPTK